MKAERVFIRGRTDSTGTVAGTSPVFPVTITVIAPRRHTPTNVGGFNNTAAGN